MVHKLNLEDTFQYLYRFWYASKQFLRQSMTRFFSKGWPKLRDSLTITQAITAN